MHKWLLFTLLLPNLTLAQSVQITEIAPHTLAHEGEWFEFKVFGAESIDMSGWQISNGKNTPKKFSDFIENLHPGENANLNGEPLIFDIGENEAYFSFLPSPIGLPNGGGVIQILDETGTVLSEAVFPKTLSRSTKNYEEREILVWNNDTKLFVPQLIRAPYDLNYTHSRGVPNSELPTNTDLYKILINEVSVDHNETDFIELKVETGLDKINLKGTEIKHNGTSLWHFEGDFWVQPNDLIVLKVGTPDTGKVFRNVFHTNKKKGLSGGSGTIEIISNRGTSHEIVADAVCWQKKTLSQTEGKRVNKYVIAQAWSGGCINIESLIPNESLARIIGASDSNTASDWFRHFNGSVGHVNESANQAPQAVITLQGTKKIIATVPFLLNVTGTDSIDPDGKKDIKSFKWFLNEKQFSEKDNPKGFYIESPGEHTLKLEVTDQAGETHQARLKVIGLDGINRNTGAQSSAVKRAVKEAAFKQIIKAEAADQELNFLAYFAAKPGWMDALNNEKETLIYPDYKIKTTLEPERQMYDEKWNRRINLPIPVRQRLKKNLGLLFSWRESPWPGLTKEWSAVVAADRKTGYFEVVYRGF